MKYLTKENITFVLALIGSIGTICGWGYTFLVNRKNIKVKITSYYTHSKIVLAYMTFENRSRLPVAITSISIKVNGEFYSCASMPVKVLTRGKEDSKSYQEYYSMPLPINLGSLSSASGYVHFEFPLGVELPPANSLDLRVSSNRGKAVEMRLQLDPTWEIR